MIQNLSNTTTTSGATRKSPQLLVVFTLDGMESRTICADTAEAQAELEKRFQLIMPGLDAVSRIWQQGSTGPT